ncbi:hypothetical protein FZI91_13960 [Mycobacterium sp. CBMA271]|uniref:hypothetical protein n=1 Tax=unclassified Mycobacteroides TaxID=2618759 RepID=UPI0012DE2175|nr:MULTISPECIES: hypothetical protein [unclassified Mycobacteroides]MUM17942.1 hypothetical protein [Mycobacteroides sp. CBMA 326]MUM22802.1 hypothetical protein [Mycobacteroides sp. CBMA 271]
MANPSVSLAVWASAWLAGRAAPDDVIDALIAWAPRHLVTAYDAVAAGHTGLSWPDMDDNGPIGLLQTIRTATGQPHGSPDIHVILPAPGDPRGLPAGTQFQRDAMESSEAIVLCDRENNSTAIGLVPAVEYDEDRDEAVGLSWTVYSLPSRIAARPGPDLGEAEYQLRQAVRTATATLDRLDRAVGAIDVDPRALVEDVLSTLRGHRLPDYAPDRAVRVLDSANQVEAIATAAAEIMEAPGALDDGAVADVLRPLVILVREARMAAAAAIIESAG